MRKYILLLIFLSAVCQPAVAQCPVSAATPFDASRGGTTTSSGSFIFSGPGSLWVQDGGLDNGDGGTFTIAGDVYINGDLRLRNNSNIAINSGGRLFIYGNVYINSGSTLTVNSGGNFYFYGAEWINEPGAIINNTAGEGSISFIQPLPAVGAMDPVSGSPRYPGNATAYTATTDAVQYLDGGGVDMDVNINHYNANNISLCNLDNSVAAGSGDTRISGTITFAVNEGDVMLNDNNFIFSSTGHYAHGGGVNDYDAFMVTNGTGEVTKEGLANDGFFMFPLGQTENDYTPAEISNTSGAANSYHVQVKTYTSSGSTESVATEGIDRTWHIHSSTEGDAFVCLYHNSATNAAGTGTDGSSFDNTIGFITQQISDGVWSSGTQSDGGSPVSTHCGTFIVPANSTAANSYFSKSSEVVSPLPVTLTGFEATVINCSAILQWRTTSEVNSSRYIVQHSTNSVDFVPVAELPSKNSEQGASYKYRHDDTQPGANYFRLMIKDKDDQFKYSQVISLRSNCATRIVITPNPVQDVLTVRGLNSGNVVTVFTATGQQVSKTQATNSVLPIDTQNWKKGLYMIIVTENGKIIKTEKAVKR